MPSGTSKVEIFKIKILRAIIYGMLFSLIVVLLTCVAKYLFDAHNLDYRLTPIFAATLIFFIWLAFAHFANIDTTGLPKDSRKTKLAAWICRFLAISTVEDMRTLREKLWMRYTQQFWVTVKGPDGHISGEEQCSRCHLTKSLCYDHDNGACSEPGVCTHALSYVERENDRIISKASGLLSLDGLMILALRGYLNIPLDKYYVRWANCDNGVLNSCPPISQWFYLLLTMAITCSWIGVLSTLYCFVVKRSASTTKSSFKEEFLLAFEVVRQRSLFVNLAATLSGYAILLMAVSVLVIVLD